MKTIISTAVLILFSALLTAAQIAPPASAYDSELAAKVGADEYGMKNYVFCILKTGPKDASISDKKQRDEIFAGHMANIQRLADEGKLALAGPFGKNDRTYRGLFIFNVTTVEEAQKLVETDPVVKSGMMTAELTPWYGSAATMLINENHKKVMKKNF
ncbi:MAG TPA: YciI family protein [Pyrinomonadaceae bacterium]|nr:YciI family protein [Pyrinomonadaceae bacterium]